MYYRVTDMKDGGPSSMKAMAESCAIVGSNKIGAVKSMLSHGINAMIFPSGNLQALKECISSLTGDPILLAKLKKESNALVNNLWSASTAAFQILYGR